MIFFSPLSTVVYYTIKFKNELNRLVRKSTFPSWYLEEKVTERVFTLYSQIIRTLIKK